MFVSTPISSTACNKSRSTLLKALANFYSNLEHADAIFLFANPCQYNANASPRTCDSTGTTSTELQQDWSHAQNDVLGYFVWLYVMPAP